MKKALISTTKFAGVFLLLFLLYIVWVLGHGTYTDFQPIEEIELASEKESPLKIIEDSTLSFIIWNVGYGGLGAESDFFFDDGGFFTSGDKMIITPENYVNKNIKGATAFLANTPADFYLLQEVDVESNRSYYRNQLEEYEEQLPNYASSFAVNYNVERVPVPVLEPWQAYGKTYSGLGTLTRFQPKKSTRIQFPGKFEWPTRIFQLDRCFSLHRFDVKGGKELVVINTHNSAYDQGGFLKKQQMAYLKRKLLREYKKGNYVVVGGDWNQCPPNVDFDLFMPEETAGYEQTNIAEDYLPEGWKWGYDMTTPTNRKVSVKYEKGKTFVTLIDFFLVSPNIELVSVKGIDQDFQFSDHQPVKMDIRLK